MELTELSFLPVFTGQRNAKDQHRGIKEPKRKAKDNPGVYFIKENDVLVYIGKGTTNVHNTLYRHFYRWTEARSGFQGTQPKYDRVTYFDKLKTSIYTVALHQTATIDECERLEKELIIKHKPRDNRRKYEGYAEQMDISTIETITPTNEDIENCPF